MLRIMIQFCKGINIIFIVRPIFRTLIFILFLSVELATCKVKQDYNTSANDSWYSLTTEEVMTENPVSFDSKATRESMLMSDNSKSVLYNTIYKRLPSLAINYATSTTCQGRCGYSNHCSCKPICLFFKTCCVDFSESCGNVYDLPGFLEEYRWLDSVSLECISRSLVVSSCFQEEDYEYSSKNTSLASYVDLLAVEETTNNKLKVDLVNLLNLMAPIANKDPTHVTALQQILMTTPLVDNSTGISHRNLSIYICNGANISHAVPWISVVNIIDNAFIAGSQVKRFQDILDFIDRTTTCQDPPQIPFLDRGSVEQCRENAVQSCPEHFTDKDVKNSCENVNFFLKIKRWHDNASLSEEYKNPFCTVCNLGLQANISFIRYSPYPRYSHPRCRKSKLHFLLNNVNDGQDLTISFKNHQSAILPMWRKISCSLFLSIPSDSERNETDRKYVQPFYTDSDHHWSLSTECRVSDCPEEFSPETNICFRSERVAVSLPPSESPLDADYLQDVLFKVKQLILAAIPGVVPASNETQNFVTSVRTFSKPRVAHRLEFQYVFYVDLDTEMGRATQRVSHQPQLLNSFRDIDFPYKQGKNYLCLSMGIYKATMQTNFCVNRDDVVHGAFVPDRPSEKSETQSHAYRLNAFNTVFLLVNTLVILY